MNSSSIKLLLSNDDNTMQRDLRRKGHDMTLITTEEVRLIREWWEKRPDGDIKGRQWRYYHEIQKPLSDFFDKELEL